MPAAAAGDKSEKILLTAAWGRTYKAASHDGAALATRWPGSPGPDRSGLFFDIVGNGRDAWAAVLEALSAYVSLEREF